MRKALVSSSVRSFFFWIIVDGEAVTRRFACRSWEKVGRKVPCIAKAEETK